MRNPPATEADWTRCPTALAAALERALATGDRRLERQVLGHLAQIGIVVFDRAALAEAVGGSAGEASR